MMALLHTACELGLIYALVAMGIYLSFRVVNFPDLTVDGSFPLGAAVAASLIVNGASPLFATAMAVVAGGAAGSITAFLHVKWRVLDLLAGILTMTALYSINLRIMGQANISLLDRTTLFTEGSPFQIVWIFVVVLVVFALLVLFLRSEMGLALRSTGANPRVARAYGVVVSRMKWLALMMSNGLIALAGALFAQAEGFADISLGTGTLITGLAALMIGEALFHSRRVAIALMACAIGSILYRIAIALALDAHFIGLRATDLNLITAALVTLALILPSFRRHLKEREQRV